MSNNRQQPSKEQFNEAVERSFGFLVQEFGFRRVSPIADESAFRVVYASDRTRVVVEGINWGLNTRIALGRAGTDEFENFDLDDLIAVRAGPDLGRQPRGSLPAGSTQLEQITYYAHALRSLAEDVLQGDHNVFATLQKRVEDRVRRNMG